MAFVRPGREELAVPLSVKKELVNLKKSFKICFGRRNNIGLVSGNARLCTGVNLQALQLVNGAMLDISRRRMKPQLTQLIEVGDREEDKKTMFRIADFQEEILRLRLRRAPETWSLKSCMEVHVAGCIHAITSFSCQLAVL